MQTLVFLYCLLWKSVTSYPIVPIDSLESKDLLRLWEVNWTKYSLFLFGIACTSFTLIGCMCCKRNKRPKGFQDCTGSINKEFKDGSSIDNETFAPQSLHGLELQVPTPVSMDHIQFEPITVERIVPEINIIPTRPKPPPASPSIFDEENELEVSTIQDSCQEWFQNNDLHIPREKLKYLREIGHGWFGKVIEGCADLQDIRTNSKNSNVVVRILSEEATTKEKAWFLGEATPYFKLRHRNILPLLGSCLESDPYLLLFESCPLGDLKAFLQSNNDLQSRQILIKENIPTRIAIEIGAGLRHMHEHGLTHTDLAARNCLVASDLSIKIGDYGIGVEKYPEDYYILGDRALPIRWSAPESVECTDTTIETREITVRANLWSYAVLLWEVAMWGDRPYSEYGDEQVIKMLLSSKSGLKPAGSQILLQSSQDCTSNLFEAIKSCLVLEPNDRSTLEQIRHIILKDQLEADTSDFEKRWEGLKPNLIKEQVKSASLQDLRGSIDSEQWPSLLQTSFRLGPEEPVKNVPGAVRGKFPFRESDSETEEESWRGRVERGVYTEKVKQKSKSVADLMILVHIEPDSDADLSLGPQIPFDKKKRLPVTGSDGDLPSLVLNNEFDLALKKLRDPISGNSLRGSRFSSKSIERPKILSLLTYSNERTQLSEIKKIEKEDQIIGKTEQKTESHVTDLNVAQFSTKDNNSFQENSPIYNNVNVINRIDRTIPESIFHMMEQSRQFTNNLQITDLDEDDPVVPDEPIYTNIEEVRKWNYALDNVLEQKSAGFVLESEFNPYTAHSSTNDLVTPSPQSRGEYSGDDLDDDLSTTEELGKKHLPEEDEDGKRMCTPDDERSSDSGFRDKESCEEEESPLAGPVPSLVASQANTPKSSSQINTEEEQLRILFELDTILDAEYYGTLNDSLDPNINKIVIQEIESTVNDNSNKEQEYDESETAQSMSDTTVETEREKICHTVKDAENNNESQVEETVSNNIFSDDEQSANKDDVPMLIETEALSLEDVHINIIESPSEATVEHWAIKDKDPEDDDSSTVSLRSDNSYMSFSIDEEFVAAIRNELKEKLPQAQTSVVEIQELQDEDDPSVVSDVDSKNWDDDDENEYEISDRFDSIDIAIRYNTYGTPLSPIFEERESASNSESLVYKDEGRDSRDVSIASKASMSEEDVLLVDTRTNRATLISSQDSQEVNFGTSDSDNCIFSSSNSNSKQSNNSSDLTTQLTFSNSDTVPLPSPEEDKWQQAQYPLPFQLQENLKSTSFANNGTQWDSDESDEERGDFQYGESALENNRKSDDDEDDEDDEEDNANGGVVVNYIEGEDDDSSCSSSEFIWQTYGNAQEKDGGSGTQKDNKIFTDLDEEEEGFDDDDDEDDDGDEDGDEEIEEEFTPSAWDATLAPNRSALRSPEKKSKGEKKSVCFKKQRYHCVYEYPKETPPAEHQSPVSPGWTPTSYADWEDMIDDIDRLNFQPMDYFENNTREEDEEEFFVSSSNRPFQFQARGGRYVSQFFPGEEPGTSAEKKEEESQMTPLEELKVNVQEKPQLGELRHTRDKLKLNLVSANGLNSGICSVVKPTVTDKLEGLPKSTNENEGKENEMHESSAIEPHSTSSDNKSEILDIPSIKLSPSEGKYVFETKNNNNNSNNQDLD